MKTRLLATGSPSELSRMFWGHTTVVHLRSTTPAMVAAVREIDGVTGVKEFEGKLLVEVTDPTTVNPVIIQRLLKNGAEITFVNELKRGLEDVYLRLLGGKQ
jgi:ABC-type multidrug transport system ATPase subunit